MASRTLVSTTVLAARLNDPAWVVVDCRFKLDDVAWGELAYESGHIPGASYAHLDRDLSGPKTGTNGRHPLPDVRALAATFGRLGIASGTQVVAYDQDTGMYASRLWWLLRWMGHDAVAVLDGGYAKWLSEGRATSAVSAHPQATVFDGVPQPEMIVGADALRAGIGDATRKLVDARAPERYAGKTEPIDKVAGHIPAAVNHFFQRNLDRAGLFRTPEELRADWRDTIGAVAPDQIVCYCGSGVTACHDLLALEIAGRDDVLLYEGSWSDWASDPNETAALGEDP